MYLLKMESPGSPPDTPVSQNLHFSKNHRWLICTVNLTTASSSWGSDYIRFFIINREWLTRLLCHLCTPLHPRLIIRCLSMLWSYHWFATSPRLLLKGKHFLAWLLTPVPEPGDLNWHKGWHEEMVESSHRHWTSWRQNLALPLPNCMALDKSHYPFVSLL